MSALVGLQSAFKDDDSLEIFSYKGDFQVLELTVYVEILLPITMPFLAKEHIPIPTKDILSWSCDGPRFDENKPVIVQF